MPPNPHILRRPPNAVNHLLYPPYRRIFPDTSKERVPANEAWEAICKPKEPISVQYDSREEQQPKTEGEVHVLHMNNKGGEKNTPFSLTNRQFHVRPRMDGGDVVLQVEESGREKGRVPQEVQWACDRLAHFSDYVPHPEKKSVLTPKGATLYYRKRT